MRVKIGPYKSWIGPYQLADLLLFRKEHSGPETAWDKRAHALGEWLDRDRHGNRSLLHRVCKWISKHRKQKIVVHIDRWDTWNMDTTLAHIILPMLQQLRDNIHGVPTVDDEDVPEDLRSTMSRSTEHYDPLQLRRWEWVMDEMIQAFQCKVSSEWEERYKSGVSDLDMQACEWDSEGNPLLYTLVEGPNHTYKCDYQGLERHQTRNQNGYRLFGKYYQALWD